MLIVSGLQWNMRDLERAGIAVNVPAFPNKSTFLERWPRDAGLF
jgi:hypothetical protein